MQKTLSILVTRRHYESASVRTNSLTQRIQIRSFLTVYAVPGMRYMSFLGLFLFQDVISLGVSFYLISYFGRKATPVENHGMNRMH
jgi:hypothetical protein